MAPGPAPKPSVNDQTWLEPSRREAERRERFGKAISTSREWQIRDLQGRDRGRVRLGLFIAAPTSGLCAGLGSLWEIACIKGEGDDRPFDRQFSPYQTRAYVEIDFERNRAFVVANPTCSPNEGCSDAKHIGDGALGDYSNEVEFEERPDGSIRISYELANARFPGILSGPSVDGALELRPNADGTMTVHLFGDRYPSWEAYYDDGCGNTQELFTANETAIRDLAGSASDRSRDAQVPGERAC